MRALIALILALPTLALHAPLEAPSPPWMLDLVPVTRTDSPVDDITYGDLRGSYVGPLTDEQREAVPLGTIAVRDPVAQVRATGGIALVSPGEVSPVVKTLSLDGRFYWDAADRRDWALRVPATARPEALSTWQLVAAGEMIFGRGVQERIETRHAGDARAALSGVRDVLRSADLAVATLEAPLSGNANAWCDTCMRFVGNERYAGALADAGIDVASLAANHIGDAGPAGVVHTIDALERVGIAHAGAGATAREAARPAHALVRGTRVAVLAYDDVPPQTYWAIGDRPGSNPLRHDDPTYASVRDDIAAARAQADVVIVLAHWGIEYESAPQAHVVAAAHAMIDAGASAVIGDHPHWVQPVELYRAGYIAYGVGNFVFDQMWSTETRLGTLQELWFAGDRLAAVRVRPTLIEDYYRPRLLRADEPAYRLVMARIAGAER